MDSQPDIFGNVSMSKIANNGSQIIKIKSKTMNKNHKKSINFIIDKLMEPGFENIVTTLLNELESRKYDQTDIDNIVAAVVIPIRQHRDLLNNAGSILSMAVNGQYLPMTRIAPFMDRAKFKKTVESELADIKTRRIEILQHIARRIKQPDETESQVKEKTKRLIKYGSELDQLNDRERTWTQIINILNKK